MIKPDLIGLIREQLDRCFVVEQHLRQGNDYTSNTQPGTYPDGLDVEVMTFAALKQAYLNASNQFEWEHVTPYIYHHTQSFSITCVRHQPDCSHHRWTVDNIEDFELVEFVYNNLYPQNPQFTTEDIFALLEKNPQIYQLNRHLKGT